MRWIIRLLIKPDTFISYYICGLSLIILTSIFQIFGQEQSFRLKRFAAEEGLSASGATCFIQDRVGFLWVGTQDGLSRYDGYTFKIYRNQYDDNTSLSGNHTKSICEDRYGEIWVGASHSGLSRYNPTTDKFKTYLNNPDDPNSISNNDITVVYGDHLGTIWVGTNGGGLCVYNRETDNFTRLASNSDSSISIFSNNISTIYEDSSHMLWVGSLNKGFCRLDLSNRKFPKYDEIRISKHFLDKSYVQAICERKNGELWIGTTTGLYSYDIVKDKLFKYDDSFAAGLSNSYINVITQDTDGNVWIGTEDGLYQYDSKTTKFVLHKGNDKDPTSLASNDIRAIYEDRQKIIWIGTGGRGVYNYDRSLELFRLYRKNPFDKNSLNNNLVWTFCEDLQGDIWIGTDEGLCRYNPSQNRFTTFKHDPNDSSSISGNVILALAVDIDGTLWVGTGSNGLCRYDYKSNKFKTYKYNPLNPSGISNDFIRGIYIDRLGEMWVSTRGGGLCRYNKKTDSFIVYKHDPKNPDSISTDEVRVVYESRNGIIWIGTYGGGLCKFNRDTGKFITYKNIPGQPNSLSDNSVWVIHEDNENILWIGTNGGLNKFDQNKNTFQAFRANHGIPNDFIPGILEDKNNNLWASTHGGIIKYNTKSNILYTFDSSDGLQSDEFCTGSYMKSRTGLMYFGGVNGFNVFSPEKITTNSYVPPIVLTGFKKFGQPAKLDTSITVAKEIVVNYWENFITFEFAALNFSKSQKNKYVYKLEGFDKDWIQVGTQRSATYTNLDGGTYVFQVKGSNNDGVWNEKGASIKVIVIPPPWKRWWAYLAYVVLLGGGLVGGVGLKIKRVREKAKIKEIRLRAQAAAELAERNAELDKMVLELKKKNGELIESQKQADRIFSALAEALPGTVLDGKYKLEGKIGTGGFGAVFKGIHLGLNKAIAIKVFRPSAGNDSASSIERFKLEGISASRINHPNAISVIDSGISKEGIAYLAMELLEGHSLTEEMVGGKKLTVERCKEIIVPICEALAEAHRLGIIHRDIKPGNIFLHKEKDGKEIVKVVDFGVAKMVSEETGEEFKNLTITGGLIGTPTYMAPERIKDMEYDGKSDVYSIGVILYEMLCGRTPFVAGDRGIAGIVMGHLTEKVPSMKAFNADVSIEVEKVVKMALIKDPNKRPTAKEFADAFSRIL